MRGKFYQHECAAEAVIAVGADHHADADLPAANSIFIPEAVLFVPDLLFGKH